MIMAQYGNAHSTNEYKAMTFAGFEHRSTGTIANLLGCCKLWHPVWVSMCLVGQWACWFAMGKKMRLSSARFMFLDNWGVACNCAMKL